MPSYFDSKSLSKLPAVAVDLTVSEGGCREHTNPEMSQKWQTLQKQQSCKFAESSMPIHSEELERQRRKEGGVCSVKSIFCCLSVLAGGALFQAKESNRRQSRLRNLENDDNSFGYNFDEQMSPRVLTRLANDDHNFD